jgi:hypothetical protein
MEVPMHKILVVLLMAVLMTPAGALRTDPADE